MKKHAVLGMVFLSLVAGQASAEVASTEGNPFLRAIVEMRVIDGVQVSPDGKLVAYRVLDRSVASDKSSVSWYVVPADGSAAPRRLGVPTEPIWIPLFDNREPGKAIWAPDSRALLVRLSRGSEIQVYRLDLDGKIVAITADPADVVSFTIDANGRALTYQTRNSRARIAAAQRDEERRGIRFDKGVSAEGLRLSKNFRIGSRITTIRFSGHSTAEEAYEGELRSRTIPIKPSRPLPDALPQNVEPYLDLTSPQERAKSITFSAGKLKIIDNGRAGKFVSAPVVELAVTTPTGETFRCKEAVCRGPTYTIRGVTTLSASGEVVIVYERASSGRTVILGWAPRTGHIRTILDAEGSLDGGSIFSGPCSKSGTALICVYAAPSMPPRLVRVDLNKGSMKTLAEPNLALSKRTYGRTRFLSWRDLEGREATGTLFVPTDVKGPAPLVITTNGCRGFPRGGASNVIAEHVLASNGFAALCVNTNRDSSLDPRVEDGSAVLGPRKGALASYDAIIEQLARENIIDRSKVGIAGHSFSANVVTYGISHSQTYSAAVIGGSISIDPSSYALSTLTRDSYRAALWTSFLNLPPREQDTSGVWEKNAPSLNAADINTPLLIEVPESEYAMSLELFGSINRAGGTTDMYVFPEEGHWLGRSPMHEYWRSLRALAWFQFWLKGETNLGPELAPEAAAWAKLRQERRLEPASDRAP